MTTEEAMKLGNKIYDIKSKEIEGDINYCVLSGSHSFELNTEDSDCDIKGIYTAPINSILGLNYLSTQDNTNANNLDDVDYEFHEICKFIKLLLKCNPTILETVFSDEKFIIYSDDIGGTLRQMAPLALYSGYDESEDKGSGIYATFLNYSRGQLHKGCNRIINRIKEIRPDLEYAIPLSHDSLSRVLNLYEMTDGSAKELCAIIENVYDRKFVSHTIRLLSSGLHCLRTGQFVVVPPHKNMCLDILNGKMPFGEIIAQVSSMFSEYESLKSNNALPNKPDRDTFNDFLINLRIGCLKNATSNA